MNLQWQFFTFASAVLRVPFRFFDKPYNIANLRDGKIVKMIRNLLLDGNCPKNTSPWIIGHISMPSNSKSIEFMRWSLRSIILPANSSKEYIFFACPFCVTSNTSKLADVFQQWWTETKSFVFAISFTWVEPCPWESKLPKRVLKDQLKNTIAHRELNSVKIRKLLFCLEFNNSNLIISH